VSHSPKEAFVYYVNLPLRFIASQTPYLERYLDYTRRRQELGEQVGPELGLELGLDATAMDSLPLSWHQDLAARLKEQGAELSLHLPFTDLSPGSVDPMIREASRKRLEAAFVVAKVYTPVHMVGHPIYNADSWDFEAQRWADCCAGVWQKGLREWPQHPPLFLENIFEQEPGPLAVLMQTLQDQDMGICFDVGHWHSFSRGAMRGNLELWIETLAPWIRHLHLHDNDGSADQHKGLGQGSIDFAAFFSLLAKHGARPGITFEPHSEEDFFQSLAYVQEHPEMFR